jgi:hypothetical protein
MSASESTPLSLSSSSVLMPADSVLLSNIPSSIQTSEPDLKQSSSSLAEFESLGAAISCNQKKRKTPVSLLQIFDSSNSEADDNDTADEDRTQHASPSPESPESLLQNESQPKSSTSTKKLKVEIALPSAAELLVI